MTQEETLFQLRRAAQCLYDKKAKNILAMDLRSYCGWCDFFLIAEGSVDRHVKALEQALTETLKKEGIVPLRVEGHRHGDWVVVDYCHFVVHLFLPEMREKYALETLWREGKLVDLKIDTSQKSPSLVSESFENPL